MRSVADTFSRGEMVLSRPWEGPYVVVHRVNDVVYGIQRGAREKPKVVHRDRIWRDRGEARAH